MKKKTKKPVKTEQLIEDDIITIHRSKGNGVLRRQVWVDDRGHVTRYSLAYINHNLFTGDNGRVLGYDNAHGFHHKHYMGNTEPVSFSNFLALEKQFREEFEVIHDKAKKAR
jgi:hypothetical protein